jgi:hypothetical protein
MNARVNLAGPGARTALAWLGAGAVAFLALGALAFSRPESHAVKQPRLYTETGAFSYAATVPDNTVYDGTLVSTGEPVFLQLVHRVGVRFDYRVSSQSPLAVAGTGSLVAELSDGAGWRREFPVAAPQPLAGGHVALRGTLDLGMLADAVRRFESATGASAAGYLVTLRPRVELHGMAGGQRVDSVYAPALALRLDDVALRLVTGQDAPGAPVQARAVAGTASAPSQLSFGRVHLDVHDARLLALGGFAVAGLLAVVLAIVVHERGGGGEPELIASRWRDRLVTVAGAPAGASVVPVASFDGLANLAERSERVILHAEERGAHAYFVEQDGVLYRYDAAPAT